MAKALAKIATAWAKSKVPGQPAEVTLPTLSITIDKDGETIAAQSVTASKSNVKNPKDLTKAGEKTKVSATATIIVTAEAIGSEVGDTTKPELAKEAKKPTAKPVKAATEAEKKAWKESGAPGKPTEVTLPHSITKETPVGDTILIGKDAENLMKDLVAKKRTKEARRRKIMKISKTELQEYIWIP